MQKNEKAWLVGGVVAIVGISSLFFASGVMNPTVPMPVYLVVMAWIISYGFMAILPSVYAIQFGVFYKRPNFGKITFFISILVAALNAYYFFVSWDYGIMWQGEAHTEVVAAENLIGFSFLIVLAALGIKRNSKTLQYSANLLLFLLLSWCAFPYLGEMP